MPSLDGVLGMGMEKVGRYTWSNKSFYELCGRGRGVVTYLLVCWGHFLCPLALSILTYSNFQVNGALVEFFLNRKLEHLF